MRGGSCGSILLGIIVLGGAAVARGGGEVDPLSDSTSPEIAVEAEGPGGLFGWFGRQLGDENPPEPDHETPETPPSEPAPSPTEPEPPPEPSLDLDLGAAQGSIEAHDGQQEIELPSEEIRGELEKPEIFFLLPRARDRSDEQMIRARIRREIIQPLIKDWLEEELMLR